MKIHLAKSAGFCFGVKRALDIARETAASGEPVYMLGDIVHNEEAVRQIEKRGIKKIKRLGNGRNKILLIRAHGAPARIFRQARKYGYRIVDATCPKVRQIHKIAKDMEKKGYRIIVIGDKKHNEVHGISGQLKNKAIVIDSPRRIGFKKILKLKKVAALVQSTQDLEMAVAIAARLKAKIKEFKFFNTVCLPTRIKQAEIKIMPRLNQAMIIIGSKTSANTKRLYQISRALNKNTHWIQSSRDLKKDWFKGLDTLDTVGITAGASTPESTINKVVTAISYL
ncbi:MAG: 4-hydroxy-3-methylbut-2-enyl diphosphate reductase [Candidatus Omnitrophica bacterium]|nr:4-hydroxy-3-methylbut-2-enyl diphosphate reductase [Candidatus Omnitrophota bacterium]